MAAAHGNLVARLRRTARAKGFRQRCHNRRLAPVLSHEAAIVAANLRDDMNAAYALDYTALAPSAFQHLLKLNTGLHQGPLGAKLVEWVSLRVSQLNGCVFCLDMHSTMLRKAGESQRKLDTLPAWRESPLFDARERAALAWAESLNALGTSQVPDDALEHAREQFNEQEMAELTFAVAAIRAWNVLNVGRRKPLPEA